MANVNRGVATPNFASIPRLAGTAISRLSADRKYSSL
jgi:hypothetical protein